MRFYHHGQLDGRKMFVPMPLAKVRPESADHQIQELYERLLRFTDAEVFHAGEWKLLDVQPAGDDTFRDLMAYRWQHGADSRLLVVNLGSRMAHGNVREAPLAVSENCLFCDLLDASEYLRKRADLASDGLYVRLGPYQAHAFEIRES